MCYIHCLAADHADDAKMMNRHLYAQLRYAEGVKDMLNRYFKGDDFPVQNYIVKEGKLASQYQ
jgi:formate dehydrogenase